MQEYDVTVVVKAGEVDVNDEALGFLNPRWTWIGETRALQFTVNAASPEVAVEYIANRIGLHIGRRVAAVGCRPRHQAAAGERPTV